MGFHDTGRKTSFGIIQYNIALKLTTVNLLNFLCFGIIQYNIALKLLVHQCLKAICFGIIQYNIALKPRRKKF